MRSLVFLIAIFLCNIVYGQDLVILSFTAEWCGPCQQMKKDIWDVPKVQNYLNRRGIKIYYIDIDKQQNVAQSWKVESVPTHIFAERVEGEEHARKELERYVGYKTSEFIYYKLRAQEEELALRKDTTVPP